MTGILNNFKLLYVNNNKIETNETLLQNIDRLITLSRNHKSAYTNATTLLKKLINQYFQYDKVDSMEELDERMKRINESKAKQINNPKKDKTHIASLFNLDDTDDDNNKELVGKIFSEIGKLKDDLKSDRPKGWDDRWEAIKKKREAVFGKITVQEKAEKPKAVKNIEITVKGKKRRSPEDFLAIMKEKLPKSNVFKRLKFDGTYRGKDTKILLATFSSDIADAVAKKLVGNTVYQHKKHFIKEENKTLHIIRTPK